MLDSRWETSTHGRNMAGARKVSTAFKAYVLLATRSDKDAVRNKALLED
ncbi:hypothetical protein [Pseudomonas citronellolis]|nr:hypothetical protein [Pseudomonas citronellolis]AMO76053.1 hypothetical protein PcP3B5_26180 [Pseudomonas citronellolis]